MDASAPAARSTVFRDIVGFESGVYEDGFGGGYETVYAVDKTAGIRYTRLYHGAGERHAQLRSRKVVRQCVSQRGQRCLL